MDKYFKMADVFESSCSVPVDTDDELYCGEIYVAGFASRRLAISASHAINSHDELVAEVGRLREALIDAATSLETIHVRSYGEDSFLDSKHEMRSYAGSRAKVARAALAEQ